MEQIVVHLLSGVALTALILVIATILSNAMRLKIPLSLVLWAFEGYIYIFFGVLLICIAGFLSMQGVMPKYAFLPWMLGVSLLLTAIEGKSSFFGL